ncbi:MAG TPA: DUF72 domain-containing protein [Nitrososphaera sp.]|nr:DUF72 domain-containing protein [Nitrososphaera sp.]
MSLLLGTCGWSYQEWVGLFYPNNKVAKLPFYAKVFNTVEVDSSFYRMPTKAMVKGWEKATGPSFKFSLKLPKTITHDKRLVNAVDDLTKFLDIIKPLESAGKLGCLLVQLAPSFSYDDDGIGKLESFIELLPSRDMHFAVELRHESWDKKETWDLLKRYNIANTITESPIEFLSKVVITSTTHSYVRWHGRGKPVWYDYSYAEEELQTWVGKLEEIKAQVPVTYAYFNNHYGAAAPRNALQFLAMEKDGELTELQQKVIKRWSANRENCHLG